MKMTHYGRYIGLAMLAQLGLVSLTAATPPPETVKYIQLWNKLGSPYEVTHSEVGSNGEIIGDIYYQPGHDGNGFRSAVRTGDRNTPNNYIVFKDLQLGPKGELEFWYTPSWNSPAVGHVVDLMYYTAKGYTANDISLSFAYNDWQNRGRTWLADKAGVDGSICYYYPSLDPKWTVGTPIRITLKWDGALPAFTPKLDLLFNNSAPAPYEQAIWGNGGSMVWNTPMDLLMGCRPYPSIWVNHPWEPNIDGVIDELKIWAFTTRPVANAGPDQGVIKNDWVQLDGSASFDYDGEAITYTWSLADKPPGSTATLSSTTSPTPKFQADLIGTYKVELSVSDGHVTSATDSVIITAITTEQAFYSLEKSVHNLATNESLNSGQETALITKLKHALGKLPANEKVAINMTQAFIHQVMDLIADGVLTLEEGAPLIKLAENIITNLKNN
jgi:hypothetical protein